MRESGWETKKEKLPPVDIWKTRTCVTPAKYHSLSILHLLAGVKCPVRVFSSELQTVHDQLKQLTAKLSAELEETRDRECLPDWSKRCSMLVTTTSKLWSGLRRSKRKRRWNSHLQERKEAGRWRKGNSGEHRRKTGAAVRHWADRSRAATLETERNTNDDSTEFEDDSNERHDTDIERQPSSSIALQARRTSRTRSTLKLIKFSTLSAPTKIEDNSVQRW